MVQPDQTFLAKARESLEGARLAYEGGRYSNSANRSYYACLQAAIHALVVAGVRPPNTSAPGAPKWNHGLVHGQFNGLLINRRHRYGPELRTVLVANYELRVQADYTDKAVSGVTAFRALRRAEGFVAAIALREDGRR